MKKATGKKKKSGGGKKGRRLSPGRRDFILPRLAGKLTGEEILEAGRELLAGMTIEEIDDCWTSKTNAMTEAEVDDYLNRRFGKTEDERKHELQQQARHYTDSLTAEGLRNYIKGLESYDLFMREAKERREAEAALTTAQGEKSQQEAK